MRISNKNGSLVNPTPNTTKSKSAAEGEVKVSQNQRDMAMKKPLLAKDLISHREMMSLAKDLKSGEIDRDEANKRFIGCVVNHSFVGKLPAQDQERIINEVTSFLSDDPEFFRDVEGKLKQLL